MSGGLRLCAMALAIVQAALVVNAETTATASGLKPMDPDSYFGINGVGFFHRPDDKEDLRWRWELMKELGVKWDRSDLWWSELEKKPGQWKFDRSDAAMKMYRDHGVQVFPILNYGAAWRNTEGPRNAEERAEWGNYVSRTVSRYKGFADYWEVWNEPNIIPFWRPQPDADQYAALLHKTAESARSASPAVKLCAMVCADFDEAYMRHVLELSNPSDFDLVSYHFYRTAVPEERTPDEVNELRLLLRQFGKECPVWVTETGVTSYFKEGVSEDLQAIRWMRQLLNLIGAGVERIFSFTLVDNLGDPGGEWGLQLGMVRRSGVRKPAFVAYKTMIAELDSYKLVGPVYFNDDVRALLFERKGGEPDTTQSRYKLAVWSLKDALDIKFDAGEARTRNERDWSTADYARQYTTLLGERKPIEYEGAIGRVCVTPAPVYVPVGSMLRANARAGFTPAIMSCFPSEGATASLNLKGILALSVRFSAPKGWTVAGNESKCSFTVPPDAPEGWNSINAQVATSSCTIVKQLRVLVKPKLIADIRPFFTTASADILTSVVVHNTNVRECSDWSLEADPAVDGTTWPLGRIACEGPEQFVSSAGSVMPRTALAHLGATTNLNMHLKSSEGSSVQRVYSIAATPFVTVPPVVDGDIGEFCNAPAMSLSAGPQLLRGGPPAAGDTSASVRAMWGADGLYVAADIDDDVPMMNNYGAGGDVYKGDGLELYVGPTGFAGQYYAKPDQGYYHFALSPGNQGNGAVVSNFESEVAGSRIAVKPRPGGYIMEAYLPCSALGGYVPKPGDVVAWDVQLNDRDDYSPNAEARAIMWNGDGMNWLRAGKWGTAVLTTPAKE